VWEFEVPIPGGVWVPAGDHGAAALVGQDFGLIGLVPLLGGGPKATPWPEWTVMDDAKEARSPLDVRLQSDGLTIDGTVRDIRELPKLADGDPRWGR